ncbi:MAG: type II toxin-antitoxin system RelE/ParE family toxin [Steroidobacteraceae bacterium]
MAIYKTRWFARWAPKQSLNDEALYRAALELAEGLFEPSLGGSLFKKRVSRPGEGKRSGFRTIVATNLKGHLFFVYGFAKNERQNIDDTEVAALKELAANLLAMPQHSLAKAVAAGELTELGQYA